MKRDAEPIFCKSGGATFYVEEKKRVNMARQRNLEFLGEVGGARDLAILTT
jgi:hypothetical protein